jgi:hypothetical protein
MSKNHFEKLIEYVINDEDAKARELFHQIVVSKSREIYENLMQEDNAMGEEEPGDDGDPPMEEGMMGGSQTEAMIHDVEAEEEGMMETDDDAEFDDEAEEDGKDLTKDIEQDGDDDEDFGDEEGDEDDGDDDGEEDLEDRVVDLEDKLDELMAEFEALMGDEAAEHGDEEGDDFDMEPVDGEVGGDAYTDDDTSEFDDEEGGMGMMENVSLQKVAPAKMGDNGANTRSPTTFNSGAAGMQGKPVRNVASESNPDGTAAYKAPTSYADKGRGDLPGAGSFKNVPAKGGANAKLAPAPKPHLAQASGVNTKTPFPKG